MGKNILFTGVAFFSALSMTQISLEAQSPSKSDFDRNVFQQVRPASGSASGIQSYGAGGSQSESGTQRVVVKKESPLSFESGLNLNVFYRTNPLMVDGGLSKFKTKAYEISAFGSVSVGNHEVLGGVFTPRVGYSVQNLSLSNAKLDFAEYYTQRVIIAGDLQYDNLMSVTTSLESASITGTKYKTEDYRELYPNLTIAKMFLLDERSSFRAAYNFGYRFTGGVIAGPSLQVNRFNNWNNSVSLAYTRQLPLGLVGQGFAEVANRAFTVSSGTNDGRTDWMRTVGGSLSYTWKMLRAAAYATYSDRKSNDGLSDFTNLDIGFNLGATVGF